MRALPKKNIDKHLEKLEGWKANSKHTEIYKTFDCPDFVSALAFVSKIAVHAEVLNHHPDIELSYGKVRVALSTHDVKGVTTKDIELAGRIECIE